MSIRLRLTLWYSGILALTLILFGVTLYYANSAYFYNSYKTNLKTVSNQIYDNIEVTKWVGTGSTGTVYHYQLPPLDEFQVSGMLIQFLDSEGGVQASRLSFPISGTTVERAKQARDGFFESDVYRSKRQSVNLLVYNRPFFVENQYVGLLQTAYSTNWVDQFLGILRNVLAGLAIVTILLAATLGWYLARKALKPIDKVIAAANRIENGADLERRIDYDGPQDEIGRLTDTINRMLARIQIMYNELEESNRTQRRFVSDASHELRTPLTTIRGNVDLLDKMWRQAQADNAGTALESRDKMELSLDAMKDIAGEAARMSRLVNDMLSLARADAGYVTAKEQVPLLPLVEEVARKAQHLPRTAQWRVGDLSPIAGAVVTGNRDYLQQLLFIFIENAFKYTPAGEVRLSAIRSGDQVGIRVADTGIGMDRDEVPHIFERFYRADPSRGIVSGTGLGLSIAKWIIDEHGGSIEVTTRKDEGSAFLIWLPISFHGLVE